MPKTQVLIGLGSNLGDGRKNILTAWEKLGGKNDISLVRLSSPYMTAPVGIDSDNQFTNAVGLLETCLSCQKLLAAMLEIEITMGRDRKKGRDRTIDLDILYYGDLICCEKSLTVPHPEIANRLFVLAPLAEIVPDLIHPALRKTSRQMLSEIETSGQKAKQTSW